MYQVLNGTCPFDEHVFLPSRMLYRKAEGYPCRIDTDRNGNDGITYTKLAFSQFSNKNLITRLRRNLLTRALTITQEQCVELNILAIDCGIP